MKIAVAGPVERAAKAGVGDGNGQCRQGGIGQAGSVDRGMESDSVGGERVGGKDSVGRGSKGRPFPLLGGIWGNSRPVQDGDGRGSDEVDGEGSVLEEMGEKLVAGVLGVYLVQGIEKVAG